MCSDFEINEEYEHLRLEEIMSSGLEASIAGTSTCMLDELNFALRASAQYMKKREEFFWDFRC